MKAIEELDDCTHLKNPQAPSCNISIQALITSLPAEET